MKKVYEREERGKNDNDGMKMKDDKVDGRARVKCVRAEMLLTDEINYSMQGRCAHGPFAASQPASSFGSCLFSVRILIKEISFIHFCAFVELFFQLFSALLRLKMSCKSFQSVSKRIRNRVEIMIHRCLGANEKKKKKINHQS